MKKKGWGDAMGCRASTDGLDDVGRGSDVVLADCRNGICSRVGSGPPFPRLRALERGHNLDTGNCLKLWTVVQGVTFDVEDDAVRV